jgi:cytochrome oxidase Cu insertion factor (SCO1/SenC/PrrC family)
LKNLCVLCAFLWLTTLSGSAQTAPQKVDLSKVGPQVGERVPDFNLKDQNGKAWTLQSIMGPKGAMLVFIRSADW